MTNLVPLCAAASTGPTLAGLDWLMIALYFGILLGVAWWVVRRSKDTAADYFLAGRNLGWWVVGASIFASNIGSEHVVGLAGSGATDGVAMAHFELHAWCLLVLAWVFVPFYARSMVFTMPEFLERRFSPASRYVLSIVSLVTFIVSKIAVGIFAGGVVFRTLLPEIHLSVGGIPLNSFWIGSVLVLVLTGLYTSLGGMRAVAYNDSVQAIILIVGSALLTTYGLIKLGGWTELRADLRVGHVQPVETAGSAGRGGDLGAGEGTRPHGLVLQRLFPLAGHALLRTDGRPVVLVHGSVHRAAGPGRRQSANGPPRQHLRRHAQAAARLPVHRPGPGLLCPGQERQGAGADRGLVPQRQPSARKRPRPPSR